MYLRRVAAIALASWVSRAQVWPENIPITLSYNKWSHVCALIISGMEEFWVLRQGPGQCLGPLKYLSSIWLQLWPVSLNCNFCIQVDSSWQLSHSVGSRGTRTSRRWWPTPEWKNFAENCIELRNMGGRGVGPRYATGMLLYIDRGSLQPCLQVMSAFALMSMSPSKFNGDAKAVAENAF